MNSKKNITKNQDFEQIHSPTKPNRLDCKVKGCCRMSEFVHIETTV